MKTNIRDRFNAWISDPDTPAEPTLQDAFTEGFTQAFEFISGQPRERADGPPSVGLAAGFPPRGSAQGWASQPEQTTASCFPRSRCRTRAGEPLARATGSQLAEQRSPASPPERWAGRVPCRSSGLSAVLWERASDIGTAPVHGGDPALISQSGQRSPHGGPGRGELQRYLVLGRALAAGRVLAAGDPIDQDRLQLPLRWRSHRDARRGPTAAAPGPAGGGVPVTR